MPRYTAVETLSANGQGQTDGSWDKSRRSGSPEHAGQTLRESGGVRFALATTNAATWRWNIPTNAQIWSPESYVLHGRDPKLGPPLYQDWLACLHPDDRAPTERAVRDALEKRTSELRIEYRVVFPTGEQRWLTSLGKVEYRA